MTYHQTQEFRHAVALYRASLVARDRQSAEVAGYWLGRADEYAMQHHVDRKLAYRAARGLHKNRAKEATAA